MLLVGGAMAGLAGAVLLVGLLLSAPSRAVIGPPPDILNAAERVGIRSASGSLLQGWWLPGRRGAGRSC